MRIGAEELEECLIGDSPVMVTLRHQIINMSKTTMPIVIVGETGTGKEVVAEALHANGPCSSGSYVQMNCAALNSSLLESELFWI